MKKSLLQFAVLVGTCFGFVNSAFAGEGCVIAGPANAPITIEEYADFECVYCAKGAEAMKKVLQDYQGKVKLVLRNMPLSAHPHAASAAKAFVAVWLQNPSVAYNFQETLFTNQSRLQNEGEEFLIEAAKSLGVDIDRMKTDMQGDEVQKILAEDAALAKGYGFRGTPSFRIGSESVLGSRPYSEIKTIIDRQMNP